MKRLIFIGGPMGVGKTTVSRRLQTKLNNTVYLDGDWCWFTAPWILNQETRETALKNIVFMLNNFIDVKSYDNIIFSWILHSDETINSITSKLKMDDVEFYNISLISTKEALVKRLRKDLDSGIRKEEVVISRSLIRLNQIMKVNSIKVDTTDISSDEVVSKILNIVAGEKNDNIIK